MNAAILICVRIESSRLPGKAMLKVEGLELLEHIIQRVKGSGLPIRILTTAKDITELLPVTRRHGDQVLTFIGDPDSPLHRMAQWLKHPMGAGTDYVVRITADDPLIDKQTMLDVIKATEAQGAGYGTSPGIVDGAGVEVIHRDNLIAAAERRKEPTEFVSYFVRGDGMPKPGIARVEPRVGVKRTRYRLTIDYPEDLLAMKVLMRACGPLASLDTYARYLDQHPYVLDMNRQPDITFYTCAKDMEPWIADTIRSVLAVRGPSFEYVLVDDGSMDCTLEVMAQFAGDPRVKLVVNDSNLGLASSSNVAVSKARGRCVVRVDGDDILLPAFSEWWPLAEGMLRAGHGIVYPAYHIINEFGGHEGDGDPRTHHHAGCAIMDRAFLNEMKYRDGLRHWDSLDLYNRVKDAGRVAYIQPALWQYRRRVGQMSTPSPEREAARRNL